MHLNCNFILYTDGMYHCTVCGFKYKQVVNRNCGPDYSDGVGNRLEESLKWFSITKKTGCRCGALRLKMNRWGPDGCLEKENLLYLVSSLQTEAERRAWPLASSTASKLSAEGLIRLAVRRERRRLKREHKKSDRISPVAPI